MSSSVFIETSSKTADSSECGGTSDSNLVVVYGKNGISFDDKGLENLIEEKKISSISVIRLTSPTPSMRDEEEEVEKLEDMLRRQDIGSDKDSSNSEDDGSSASEDSTEKCDSSNDDENEERKAFKESDESSEESKSKQRRLPRRRARQSNMVKQKKTRRRRRERPEIVGLRLEEFYPPEDANEIIKEALKMAGLRSDKKSKSDCEFELFVIQNDHCYTPYTSPSQMKAKLAADKLEAEKHAANRKISVLQTAAGKQLFIRKKLLQNVYSKSEVAVKANVSITPFTTDKNVFVAQRVKKDVQDRKPNPEVGGTNEGDELRSFDNNDDAVDEDESDFGGTEYSAETDNDRDSDLDYDVNNPKGRKRKVKLLKTHKRTLNISKVFNPKSRRNNNQDDAIEIPSKPNVISNVATCSPGTVLQRQKSIVKIISDPNRITIRSTPSKAVQMMGKANFLSPVIAALPPIPKKQTENKSLLNTSSNSTSISMSPKTYVLVKGPMENKSSVQTSPQTHKEIVINKQVMSSPKTKGFTDLTKLIEQTEKQKPVKTVGHLSAPKSSHTATITSVVTFSPRSAAATPLKGFMPIETAAKNQLPAQISIQTHQSSSELEAEHDKQLDLINSIVQDEMQKSNEKADDQISNINDNIPELVKMLESTTEKVLASNNAQKNINLFAIDNGCNSGATGNKNINLASVSSSPSAHNLVGGIDISSASLLATPEGDGNDADDLPDDILQQVVELIKDDKTLQEAVEKQVFGSSVCSEQGIVNNMVVAQNPPPLAPISQQPVRIQENTPTSSKSIIQLAISNVPTSLASSPSSTRANAVNTTRTAPASPMAASVSGQISYQTSKTSPLIRKEPIQIVRGNGRVITLPPIEAPTTRAKRRAQTQPIANANNVGSTSFVSTATLSESSLDSSMQSNSSVTAASGSTIATGQDKKSADSNTRRRGSKENATAAATTSNQKATRTQKASAKKGGNKSTANKSKVEPESTESEEDDDDDPNKLWCICRQPHNNRFMICCDVCEDWFHGTCVSITKAMGLEMEQKGIDWTCPKCNKKQEEKKQPKITDMLIKKAPDANSTQSEPSAISSLLPPPMDSPAPVQKIASSKVPANSIDVINIKPKKESVVQNVETPHLKLQSGQIINLKDFSTSAGKRATIIQTSSSSTTPLTAAQKKLFVTSGQANLKMSSQPGTPIRTITVVKQLTPQQNYNQNIKVIKTISPATTSASQNLNIVTTSVSATPIISVCSSTSTSMPSTSSIPSSTEKSTMCIVCKKTARPNSIYCSDDCIRKHAQNALNSLMTKAQTETSGTISPLTKGATEDKTKKKSKGLFEELLSAADRKPKVERVNVYERKSGRVITGNNAPTATNLKKWLQDNPTFEVIQPGSTQAIDLEKKQKQRTQHSSSPLIAKSAASSPPPLKMFSLPSSVTPNRVESSVASSPSPQTQTKTQKNIADYLKSNNSHIASPRPSTPKQLQKYPSHVSIKPEKAPKAADESKSVGKEKTLSTKRQTSTDGSSKSSNNDGEPIRLVVRRTLKEQLLLRITEETANAEEKEETLKVNNLPKLTEEEIDEFAKETELEMYNYFNKDTGIKYKAKYRSLVFNIKDRKNHTLFAKICGKLILPKQLVRMSPEEMASQELAQWREQENKHQLEMIKKSELDLLTCAKNYVLKTHKGEEVIEGKSSDYANVDITIPVEDVVSAINNSELPDTGDLMRKESQTHWSDADTTFLSHSHSLLLETSQTLIEDDKSKSTSSHSKERDREREKEKETEKERVREKDKDREKDKERLRGRDREREKRRKSKDRHHDKFRSRKKSRSHSRSRSREKVEKRHKSSHKEEKRDRDERVRPDKERAKDIRDRTEREHHSDLNEKKPLTETKKSTITQVRQTSKKFQEQPKAAINPMDTYNLIDQILESTKTVEEAANLISERDKDKEIENQRRNAITPQPVQPATSTVSTCSSSADSTFAVDIPSNLVSVDSDQEPTSTVSIPTPPHDPYSRFIACSSPSSSFSGDIQYAIVSLWTGNINMVDVTSFQLSLQPIVGNSTGLAKLMPKELDVVGRIGPETVWDYISKIKKSPNKEIVVIRLIPASESETVAYKILYEYLDNRNRLGVIKSVSSHIKDFYIYPLGAGKNVPHLLQTSEPVDFYNDPARPDVLIGIIVRVVVSKRTIQTSSQSLPVGASTSSVVNKISSRSNDMDKFTPPGSPKTKKRRQSVAARKVGEIDIDAIIKAPITAKAQKAGATSVTKLNENDADEPYSPGGSSDDDMSLLPVKMSNSMDHAQIAEDELKRKMEEINRQIAAQEMEIAGLLTGEPSTFGSATSSSSNVLANISIPSNLSQILASIKTSGKDRSAIPPPPPLIGSLLKSSTSADEVYNPENSTKSKNTATESNSNSTSLLAKLSEAELLSMVPDDIVITPNKPTRCEEPPPPGV